MPTVVPAIPQLDVGVQPDLKIPALSGDAAAFQQLLQLLALGLNGQQAGQVEVTGPDPEAEANATDNKPSDEGTAGANSVAALLHQLEVLGMVASSAGLAADRLQVMEGKPGEIGARELASALAEKLKAAQSALRMERPVTGGGSSSEIPTMPAPTETKLASNPSGCQSKVDTGNDPKTGGLAPILIQQEPERPTARTATAGTRAMVEESIPVDDGIGRASRLADAGPASTDTPGTIGDGAVVKMLKGEAEVGQVEGRNEPLFTSQRKEEGSQLTHLQATADSSPLRADGAVQRMSAPTNVREVPPQPSGTPITTVRLDVQPTDVGRVRLHVTLADHTIHASVVAERPEVQDFLARNYAKLESGLQAHGLGIGGFQVEVQGQGRERPDWEWTAAQRDVYPRQAAENRDGDIPTATERDQHWDDRRLSVFV